MKLRMKHYLMILLLVLFTFVSCSTKQKEIVLNEEFFVIKQKAMENDQNFCIVLLDTTDITSRIYKERLENSNIKTIFNIVNVGLPENNWYGQWLYSNSAPVTCIFTSSGKLIDIIPGASRKCFKCIEQVVKKGSMSNDLEYYNHFSKDKREILPLLCQILQCKFDLDKGANIESQINNLSNLIRYPYVNYLKMMNSLNHGQNEMAQLSAEHLLAFKNDLELEIYPEFFSVAKSVVNPEYDSKMEPVLECETTIYLDECRKNIPKSFGVTITNIGGTSLEIQDIQLDCSCIALVGNKTYTILPQKSQYVSFNFTADKDEEIVREMFFKSNGIKPIKRVKIITNSSSFKRKEVL